MSSFADASAAAIASLAAPTPTDSSTPAPSADPTQSAPVETQPQAPDGAAPAAPQTFKVKDNGQEVELTLDELTSAHLRHRDYTRKTMELAEQRKHLETTIAQARQREEAINGFLKDANQVARYYQFLTGKALQQNAPQPSAPPPQTYDEALQQLYTQQQHIQQALDQRLNEVRRETKQEVSKAHEAILAEKAAKFENDIQTTLQGILNEPKFQTLHSVDDIDNILVADVMKLYPNGPPSWEAARAGLLQAAEARAEKLDSQFKEMLKKQAIQQASLTRQGIEPPGGTPPHPAPKQFKLGDKGLSQAAEEFLRASSKR